jgi:AcrR family transcriptional regulator
LISVRHNIIECARDLFLSQGFYKTPIDAIASELQISKKTIYKHFPSKEKLLNEIANNMISGYNKRIKLILDSELDSAEKFYKLFEYYSVQVQGISQKWMKDVRLHSPRIWKKIEDFKNKHIYSIMSQLLEQGKRENLVEDVNSDLVIESITAVTLHLLSPENLFYTRYSHKEIIEFIFDSYLTGLLTDKGRVKYKKNKNKLKK